MRKAERRFDVASLGFGEESVETEGLRLSQALIGSFDEGVVFGANLGRRDIRRGDGVVLQVEFAFEFVELNGASGVFCRQADDDVAQFADVAGEAVARPELLGFWREREVRQSR